MKEYPLLFKTEMVQAILNTRPGAWPAEPIDPALPFKWLTRRIISPKHLNQMERDTLKYGKADYSLCPYGVAGDRLWVRETWTYVTKAENEFYDRIRPDGCPVEMIYRADVDEIPANWTPSIFMPRWASRIDLEIKAIRVERLQAISKEDAKGEGVWLIGNEPELPGDIRWTFGKLEIGRNLFYVNPAEAYRDLWDSINAKRGYPWTGNPYVWVIEFMRLT